MKPKPTPGEILLFPHDCSEALLRGHLTTEEAAKQIAGYYDRREREATGEAVHTWAHRGLYADEDGEVYTGCVYYGDRFKGKRGSFAVTEIDTREVPEVDPYDARRALDGAE